MEAKQPHVLKVIRSRRRENPGADAVAMHPDTVEEVRGFVERYVGLVRKDPFTELVVEGGDPSPEDGVRICGWTVLQSRDIPKGEVQYVQYIGAHGPET